MQSKDFRRKRKYKEPKSATNLKMLEHNEPYEEFLLFGFNAFYPPICFLLFGNCIGEKPTFLFFYVMVNKVADMKAIN